MNDKYAVITGASGGLGRAFAYHLAQRGTNLILIARNKGKMNKLKEELSEKYEIDVINIVKDLSADNAANEIGGYILRNNFNTKLLINNAGKAYYKKFEHLSNERSNEIINVNIRSTINLTNIFINIMKENSGGHILNVASTFAFRQSPDWAVYGASKSFIYSFSRSLNLELKGSGISISVLCPGKINTEFDINSGRTGFSDKSGKDPMVIAESTIKDLYNGKSIILPGIDTKIKFLAYKLLPVKLISYIIK